MTLRGLVLAAVDITDDADETLAQASALARDLRSPLIVVHVLPDAARVRMLFPQFAVADTAAAAARQIKIGDALQARIGAVTGRSAADVETVLDTGTPHAGILSRAEAAGAGVIVMGPGAVSERVARYAGVPVLVARPSPRGAVLGATDFSDPASVAEAVLSTAPCSVLVVHLHPGRAAA